MHSEFLTRIAQRSVAAILLTTVVLSAGASPAVAQANPVRTASTSSATATVRLHLEQPDESPVIGAEVSVKGDKVERLARSDSAGVVTVEGFAPGNIEIRVRRIGFKQTELLTRVGSGHNEFTVTVDGPGVSLDELRIIGDQKVVGRLEDFDMRTKRGEASAVVTLAQIEKRNPVKLSQMLRGMPGLRLADSLGSTVAISTRGQKLAGRGQGLVDCVMRVMVDGIVMPAYTSLDAVFPKDAYGIEVFNGPARIPLNMGGMRQDNWCGLIAIWTRSG